MGLFRRREEGDGGRVDWLVVGLGNPGRKYERTRHNVGFEVVALAAARWDLPQAKQKFGGLYTEGRTGPGGARVGVLLPQTFMNESGRAAGPARGSLHVPLDRVVAVHDEIDLPFGRIHARLGGGLAGHNGLKSLDRELGGREFRRVRVGVGRPDTTDPAVVVPYVLGRFDEPQEDVQRLFEDAVDELDRLVTTDPADLDVPA
jgi:PTH1 family peptidyl-tRNA hydrolase